MKTDAKPLKNPAKTLDTERLKKTIAERVRVAMEGRELGREEIDRRELGRRLGVSPGRVSQIVVGTHRLPSLETLIPLADALEVSLDWLAGRSEQPAAGKRRR